MCIPVHSPWLPGYIDVAQTVLIRLTTAGHFQTDLTYMRMYIHGLSHDPKGWHIVTSTEGDSVG